ncbi:MAG: cupin domain-containing protein [Rhodospirillales bacterium]|nr:cupin domain-containing protein [Rhodospirillales bacterium]
MKRTILAAGALILAAATSIPAYAHGTNELQETVTPVFQHELPNVPGKSLIAFEVEYPAGGASPSHTHPKSAFIYAYVLEGEIVSAVDDEAPRVYRAGEGWYEVPGAHHRVSRNASKTKPAKLLAIFVMDPAEKQVVFPDAK